MTIMIQGFWTPLSPCFALSLGLIIGVSTLGAQRAYADSPEALVKKVLDRSDDMYRGLASKGEMTMKVVTAHWTRSLDIDFWAKGKSKSFIRITSPKKEKGTATLRLDKDMWNYLPKVKRVIKVPNSMMGGSWMGSHFSNDDLVKQSRMADDFNAKVTFKGKREGKDIVEVTGTATENAVVVWGKFVLVADAKSYDPIVIKYFDEDMELARTMTFSDSKQFGKRNLPSVIKVIPVDNPKEYTEVRYHKVDFDADIPDKIFTKRYLKR